MLPQVSLDGQLNGELLHELAPDLIIGVALSPELGISDEDVRELAEEIDSQPMVIALDPHTVGEVLGDYRTIAQATDSKDQAVDLIREASDRIDRVRLAVRKALRPRVAALESLDPPRPAGYWTPQLIEYAGGEDVLGFAGETAESLTWEEIAAFEPEVVLVMPAGLDAETAYREAEMHSEQLAVLGAATIVALDAASYFSRPGPRIIDAMELLAALLHPDLIAENPEHANRALPVEL